MSSGGRSSRNRSHSSLGKVSTGRSSASARQTPPPITLTPENADAPFAPCAATASFLLYAQRNQILVAHHDTLAIERRFDLHREDVLWIAVDNASERGSGRIAVSYDAGSTAIVWDILSGGEIARFSAYEHIKVATFMRNGNIAFGNNQGNIILFEPSTSEHISARTIFDPITAIAPSSDNLTFAIGYMNGSILVATLQPSFTILHTLTTTRAPSRITGLAWHGSSSKQKTDMLATQTLEGDLRVWSVPKAPFREAPTIIRVLQRTDFQQPGPCWFGWSKNGRIVQYADGETRAWDVRTKKVTYQIVPTVDDVVGLANYGPSATLFTLSRNHGVQQYDLNPSGVPVKVASVQHVPANTPPTPPATFDELKKSQARSRAAVDVAVLPGASDTGESSADEAANRSPLQRIAREMESLDAMEDELRDKLMPLSPSSSRTSSVSSKSSGAGPRTGRKYLYDKPGSSGAPSSVGDTEFSMGTPSLKQGRESMSIRSVSSMHSNARYRSSNLRNQIARSPEEVRANSSMDLFPKTRARLRDVPYRSPHYGNGARTPELLQREMLSVVFGWNDTVRSLILDELQRHRIGSAAAVLLAKWLGETGPEYMASMVGSESMTSADWMMLALSSIGADSQKKVGEAFVQRLLEKDDVHPAVAILVGLGENHDAIEVYVSQNCWLEAVLLTCLTSPSDWQRISHLIRQMGAFAVQQGQPDLAVRCFSCTSIETSEPWFSPRAQDAAYAAQQEKLTGSSNADSLSNPPLSPPSRSGSQRLAQKNAQLKLITSFGDRGAPMSNMMDVLTPTNAAGVTPIAQSAMPHSALEPSGQLPGLQTTLRNIRDPTSARTATPGGYQKKRVPSRSDIERAKQEAAQMATPITASREVPPVGLNVHSRRTLSLGSNSTSDPINLLKPTVYKDSLALGNTAQDENHLPSPSTEAFNRYREDSRGRRNSSSARKPDGLILHVVETQSGEDTAQGPVASSSRGAAAGSVRTSRSKARSIDDYIDGVEEARELARGKRERSKRREESKKRDGSRGRRGASRPRELSGTQGLRDLRYIKPAKRSPSSPVSMSPEEIWQASREAKSQLGPEPATSEDENFYKIASPVDSHKSLRSFRSEPQQGRKGDSSELQPEIVTKPTVNLEKGVEEKSVETQNLPLDRVRGRTGHRESAPTVRSPSSPLPMPTTNQTTQEMSDANSDGRRVRLRADSHVDDNGHPRRTSSRQGRERSTSRKPAASSMPSSEVSKSSIPEGSVAGSGLSSAMTDDSQPRPRTQFSKELAAKELEERRLSLARRPSAPSIPLPGEIRARPHMGPRANTDLSQMHSTNIGELSRAQSVDPDLMSRYGKITGTSTSSTPIGLPATPRAMRHPRYMSTDPNERDAAPPVPEIPEGASNLSSMGSSLSQVSNAKSSLTNEDSSSVLSSDVSSNRKSREEDYVPALLPSTVFGQKVTEAPFARAASAPPEKWLGGAHPAYKPGISSTRRVSNVRKIAPADSQTGGVQAVTSIDEALASSGDQQVVVIPELVDLPPMLPELQHLSGPPPPPPPPKLHMPAQSGQVNTSGVINITIDETLPASAGAGPVPTLLPSTSYSQPTDREMPAVERATTTSPSMHRRGRGSGSESLGSRFRDLSDRMRSTSRNRTKSPANYVPSPYETILPPLPSLHQRRESESRAKSPYEQAMAAQNHHLSRQLLPSSVYPSTLPAAKLEETTIPPSSLPRSQSAMGHGNPKEIRANMPPDSLQQGAYPGPPGFL